MPTIYERIEIYRANIQCSPLTISEKADLGEIILKYFYTSGYNKNQTALYRSLEPEGTFTVINYPDSFTEKIDQCVTEFFVKKNSPQENIPEVTQYRRKRISHTPAPVKKFSAKPENK